MPILSLFVNTALLRGFLVATMLAGIACGGRGKPPAGQPAPRGGVASPARAMSAGAEFDAVQLYTQMGLLSTGAPLPFVGGVSYFAAATPDSTNIVVGLSLANAALSFSRDNDRFVADYTVDLTLRQGGSVAREISAHESVRVASYRESGRTDESVIFQQGLTAAPGQYVLTVSVRDDGSGRTNSQEMLLAVPRLGEARSMSSPAPFLRVVPRRFRSAPTDLVSNTRALAIFGRDTVLAMYVEGYGEGDEFPVVVEARNDEGRMIWHDTASLPKRSNLFSGAIYVPVAKVGIGVSVVSMWPATGADTVRTPVFIAFGEELPVAKFEDMIEYLRWFAAPHRLKALRDTAPESRPGAWIEFVKSTDASPETEGNEELQAYFERLLTVSVRFKEEGVPGWKTDRGKVFLGLGEPAQVFDQGISTVGDHGRAQVWEYRNLNIQLVFYDQTGFGRWRLTNAGESVFQAQWLRRLNR